jgi:hypothetical protein
MYKGGLQVYSIIQQACLTGAATTMSFELINFDDLGIWNPGAPTQFVVPAGVGHIRIYWHSHWAIQTTVGAINGNGRTRPFLNGAAVQPVVMGNTGAILFTPNSPPTNEASASALSQLIPATPGDVWTLVGDQGTGQTLNLFGLVFGAEFYD